MKYKLKCPTCKKRVKVSTHDAVKYKDTSGISFSFDCPKCGEEIIATQEVKK